MLPTFTGGAYYDETNKFSKLSFEDIAENTETMQAKNSWISMIEHYFFSAWLPTANLDKTIYTDYQNSIYTIGSSTGYITLNPGKSISYDSLMFVGPKLQSEISDLTEGLDLTVDYGVLTFLSAPLFWILESINKIFGNWGFSIIALTLLIKAVFFKLSETSYRSMAEMKKLTPRMQALKERYSEDKKKFSEALMRMYKEEKVNPLGGCLPILIQIPVFIALYWVLVESIEIRHAPFIGWIQDLSSADPLFILPIAMGVSMYVQQKLNPAPADPMQQKIFLFLPFIFTALFATFPSGLVLYWLTNNILSIAQQYVINKRIVG
jgi:YidC/Oxa1 family membrane protein insertase